MSWALKGLNTPLKNKTFPIKPGLTLGRQGDVVVPDSKASSIHARISQSTDGQWRLEDNNSKNGVRLNGERITSADLVIGMVFNIGDFGFEVIETTEETQAATRTFSRTKTPLPTPPPLPEATTVGRTVRTTKSAMPPPEPIVTSATPRPTTPAPVPEVAPTVAEPAMDISPVAAPSVLPTVHPPVKKGRLWSEILSTFLEKHSSRFKSRPHQIVPMEPAVVLDFVRGVQTNAHWVIGYGPRLFGASSLDLPIWQPGAPAACFELIPSNDGILFHNHSPDIVLLNGQSVDKQVLHVGDTIGILETLIEVDFIE